MEIARLRVVLEADTSALDAALRSAPERARRAVESAAAGVDSVGERMSRLGASVTGVGARMSAAVTEPLLGIGAAAINVAAQYERSMDVFQSTSNATAAQMRDVSETAQRLGSDLTLPNTSAKDAVSAMLELTKAGLSVDNAMAAARGSIQLAATENMNVGRAAEIAANALNMWNLPGREASRVADMLAAAAASSSGGVMDMAIAMRNGGAAFAGAKIPMDAFMTSVGLLAKNGIQGSLAGTGLRSMLLRLTAPTDEAAATMKRLGIQIFDAQGQMRPWSAIIGNLQTAFRGLGDEQRQTAMKTIFGTYAIQSANVLIREGSAGYAAMHANVTRAGAAAEMAGAQNRGLLGAIDALKSSVETLAISLTPYLTTLADVVRRGAEWVSGLNNLSPAMRNVVVTVGLAAAAFGPLLVVAGNLMSAFGAISTALPALGVALGAATGPVGALVIAVGALGLAYATNFAGMRDAVNGALRPVLPILREVGALLGELGTRYGPVIRTVLVPAVQALAKTVGDFARTTLTGLRGVLQLLNGEFKAGFSSLGTSVMQGMANGVLSGQSLVTNAVTSAANAAVTAAKNALGIRSPSAVFAEIGEHSVEGFEMGMVRAAQKANAAAKLVADQAARALAAEGIHYTTAVDAGARLGNACGGAFSSALMSSMSGTNILQAMRGLTQGELNQQLYGGDFNAWQKDNYVPSSVPDLGSILDARKGADIFAGSSSGYARNAHAAQNWMQGAPTVQRSYGPSAPVASGADRMAAVAGGAGVGGSGGGGVSIGTLNVAEAANLPTLLSSLGAVADAAATN